MHTLSIQNAKFKFHQYQLRAIFPNLMLVKVTHYYTVRVRCIIMKQFTKLIWMQVAVLPCFKVFL